MAMVENEGPLRRDQRRTVCTVSGADEVGQRQHGRKDVDAVIAVGAEGRRQTPSAVVLKFIDRLGIAARPGQGDRPRRHPAAADKPYSMSCQSRRDWSRNCSDGMAASAHPSMALAAWTLRSMMFYSPAVEGVLQSAFPV